MSERTLAAVPVRWRGVNHNIYSQSTWTSGGPNPGHNYVRADHRTIDYFRDKGVNHLRMMFTWEWLQPTLSGPVPGPGASMQYWDSLVDTVDYATGQGVHVTLAHHGYSANFWPAGGGSTTPTWKGVGSGDGTSYTNRIGGPTITNAVFADLWTKIAVFYRANDLVSFGLVNEPHHTSTMGWFATVQSVITAIRGTGSTAWIHVPGNGWATYDVHATGSDTASPKRSNAYGWANANGPGAPLSDPLDKLVAECHIYLDDNGGAALDILPYAGGAPVDAARDRLAVMVEWARPLGLRVHVGEIGFYAGTAGAQTTWDAFAAYCDDNVDVVTGFDWWGASEADWWTDPGAARFSVSPTTGVPTVSGDTANMTMIASSFATAAPSTPRVPLQTPPVDLNGFFHLDSGLGPYVGYVPQNYDPATAINLFVWMHGCGGDAEGDLWAVAPPATRATQSYIAVSLGGRDGECWDVNSDGPRLLAAVADVQRYFAINARGIHVGGYSSGGDMAYRHGLENASIFAGILAENSDPFRDTGSTAAQLISAASWRLNIGHVAHRSDNTYPIAIVRSSFATLVADGFPATLVEKDGTHFDADAGTSGTVYDLIHSLLPFLELGWALPLPR
jgi:aryl-phospho-beta-D-glucosidase BglC (GH1 family)